MPRSGGSGRRSKSSIFRRRVRRGTLIDATLIAAAVKSPPYGDGGVNPRDPDARITMKRKKSHFGYKGNLAVDEGSGLVRTIRNFVCGRA